MFEELGRDIAQHVWENREELEGVDLWKEIQYDTMEFMLDNGMITYFQFEWSAYEDFYTEIMETFEGFMNEITQLLEADPTWTIAETETSLYITRQKPEE